MSIDIYFLKEILGAQWRNPIYRQPCKQKNEIKKKFEEGVNAIGSILGIAGDIDMPCDCRFTPPQNSSKGTKINKIKFIKIKIIFETNIKNKKSQHKKSNGFLLNKKKYCEVTFRACFWLCIDIK